MNRSARAQTSATPRIALLALIALATPLATGCEEKGPMEQAGEKVDKAAKDVGESVDNAVKDAGKGVEEAGKEIQEAVDGK